MSLFTQAHIKSMAAKLSESLGDKLDDIAQNRGALKVGGVRRDVAELSDGEISGVLAGLYEIASSFADWMESSMAMDDDESRRELVRADVTYAQIESEIDGAAGESFFRRHPEKHAFAGRLRKMNETVRTIREFRSKLRDLDRAALSTEAKKTASDFAYSWYEDGATSEIERMLAKVKWKVGLSDDEREAMTVATRELESLKRLITRVRDSYSTRLKEECDRTFERRAA